MAKEITIAVPEGKTAEWVNDVLTLVDEQKKDDRPVTERIKTFDDAVRELGENHPFVIHYNTYMSEVNGVADDDEDVVATLQLRIITAALNEGWTPSFDKANREYRYAPWFELYTQSEIVDMSEEERREKNVCLVGGSAHNGLACGLAFVTSYIAFSHSPAYIGSRLAYKSSELAKYSGRQFTEIWKHVVFKSK